MAMRNTRDDRKPRNRDKRSPDKIEVVDTQATEVRGHHAQLLTAHEVSSLNALDPQMRGGEGARYDIAETLMDDETLSSLKHYRSFFEMGGVSVGATVDALPEVIALARLERRLDHAREAVHRNLLARVAPLADTASEVHRLLVGTPEHSPMRAAFEVFEGRWRDTFRGGRATKSEARTPVADPARQPK